MMGLGYGSFAFSNDGGSETCHKGKSVELSVTQVQTTYCDLWVEQPKHKAKFYKMGTGHPLFGFLPEEVLG
jgi:hypothetical protein